MGEPTVGAAGLPGSVFWDMDGTLLDTEPIWETVLVDFAHRLGTEMTPALRHSTMGNSAVDAMTKVYDAAQVPESRRRFDVDEQWMITLVLERFAGSLPWRPGAVEALEMVQNAGIPMVLVTNTMREVADVMLETIGRHRFAATVCGDEVQAGKPEPYSYRRAAELVGLPIRECLAVEDSPTGAAATYAAGIRAIIVPSSIEVPPRPTYTYRETLVGLTLADLVSALRA